MDPTRTIRAAAVRALPAVLLALLASCSPGADRVALVRVLPDEAIGRPVHLAPVPGDPERLVLVEKEGLVRWFVPDAKVMGGVLLDARAVVSTEGWEEGLLSIAFHPRFAENRLFFVYYSAADPRRSVVARFRAEPDALRADLATREIVLEVPQPNSDHNGGQLAFGPDGFLYIGLGDGDGGGGGGDPHENGQNPETLLGSVLRIDVDREADGKRYAVPADNPFAAAPPRRPEIWAYGLRNPWRFSFDRESGQLFLADVGQNEVEEVDRIVKGGNYGWNTMEGLRCFDPPSGCDTTGLEMPVSQYTHDVGRSVTGGFVYRGSAIRGLQGRYVFGDFIRGKIWTIPADTEGFAEPELLLEAAMPISSFGEDAQGELYVLHFGGEVHKLVAARP